MTPQCNLCPESALVTYRHGESRCAAHAIPRAQLDRIEAEAVQVGWDRADELGRSA